jgi:lysozyme
MAKPLPDPALPWPIIPEGVFLIAESESLLLTAARCPAGVPTIGWGETDGVRMGDTCTKEQADKWLCDDLVDRTKAVLDLCSLPPSKHELAALVSFAYNVGVAGLAKSTVLRCHNGGDHDGAARAFGLWNKARNPETGELVVLNGLSRRRAAEAALYLTSDDDVATPIPQAVESESNLAASPIARGGAITIGAGTLSVASAAADELGKASEVLGKFHGIAAKVADWIGVPVPLLLGIVLVATGIMVIRWRRKQREGGWA